MPMLCQTSALPSLGTLSFAHTKASVPLWVFLSECPRAFAQCPATLTGLPRAGILATMAIHPRPNSPTPIMMATLFGNRLSLFCNPLIPHHPPGRKAHFLTEAIPDDALVGPEPLK